MTEDYPRYPDIHEVDLTLLNPRMIVVCLYCWNKEKIYIYIFQYIFCLNISCLCLSYVPPGCYSIYEPVSLHRVAQHPYFSSLQLVQDHGTKTLTCGQCCWRSKYKHTDTDKELLYCHLLVLYSATKAFHSGMLRLLAKKENANMG